MIKRILCLCIVLIALMGISVVSACDVDNCTVEQANLDIGLMDFVQSIDNGFEKDCNHALVVEDKIVSERGRKSDTYVNLSEDKFPSIKNDVKSNINEMDHKEKVKIAKAVAEALRSNETKFAPIDNVINSSDIEFVPETGIVKKTIGEESITGNNGTIVLKGDDFISGVIVKDSPKKDDMLSPANQPIAALVSFYWTFILCFF